MPLYLSAFSSIKYTVKYLQRNFYSNNSCLEQYSMPQISSAKTVHLGVEEEGSWWETLNTCTLITSPEGQLRRKEGESRDLLEKPWKAKMQKGLKAAHEAVISFNIAGKWKFKL